MAEEQLCLQSANNPLPTWMTREEIIPPRTGRTFRDAAESYVKNGGKERYLHLIMPYLGDQLLEDIAPFDILNLAKRLYPTQKNATRNRQVIMPVRAVIYHAASRRWSPHYRIPSFREEEPQRKKSASPEWLHLFDRQALKDGAQHIAALVMFMATTGARISEALRLDFEDVDLINRTVILRKTKTGTNSVRTLTNRMVARLADLQKAAAPGKPVFRITCRHHANARIKEICGRADIPYKSSHACGRHAFANIAMGLGADIKMTMIAGGWKSTSVFLGVYVNPKNSGMAVAEKFNTRLFEADV